MKRKFSLCLLIIALIKLAEAQESTDTGNIFDRFVENAISLAEQALYDAKFEEALKFIEPTYFEKFDAYEPKHKILLSIQNIRIKSFQSRLHQTAFSSKKQLAHLLELQKSAETLADESAQATYFTMLSALYRSENLDSCIFYENKALDLFNSQADYKSVAVLRATRISRTLDDYFRDNKKEEAIALIPSFRKEIDFSSKHSQYALAYNTRHLANIYRIYEVDQEEALRLYQQSLALREVIGFKPFIPASHFSIGEAYMKLGKYALAREAYLQSAKLAEKINFVRYTIRPFIRIGDMYAAQGDKVKAKEFYVKAVKAASKNNYTDKGIEQIVEKIIGTEK